MKGIQRLSIDSCSCRDSHKARSSDLLGSKRPRHSSANTAGYLGFANCYGSTIMSIEGGEMNRTLILFVLSICIVAIVAVSGVGQLEVPGTILASLDHTWTGSGVIVSPDGYILTNNHVVEGASDLYVEVTSGDRYPAELVATEPDRDLALIKVEAHGLTTIPISPGRDVQVGESVVSIGSPRGLVGTVSQGIITAIGRSIESLGLDGLYQTNAGITHGSSGGPLIDEYGQLIGINVAVAISGSDRVPLTEFGFAIPIGYAQRLLSQVMGVLPTPASESDRLSVPEIAARCSTATVYIVGVAETALSSVLPQLIDGYDMNNPRTWKKPPPAEPLPLAPEESPFGWPLILPKVPLLLRLPESPQLPSFPGVGISSFSLPGWLGSPSDRLGSESQEYAFVSGDGTRRSAADGEFHVHVLLALYESASEASIAAKHVLEKDMEGLQQLGTGKYKAGQLSFDSRLGIAIAEGTGWANCNLGTNGVEPSGQFARAMLEQPKCPTRVFGAQIRQTATLAIDELLVAISISWRHTATLLTPPSCITGEGNHTYKDSCVTYWVKRTETRLQNVPRDGMPWLIEEKKILEDRTRTLICIDEVETEAKRVLIEVVSALAAGL